MKKFTKEKAQYLHAKRRAFERYDLLLTKEDYKHIVSRIQTGRDCKFLERQSNRLTVFLVKHTTEWYPVVYDKLRKTVVTFLPQEYLAERI